VAEAVGGALELLGDGRIDVGIIASIGGDGVRPQQVRQELGVGDVSISAVVIALAIW
jgi:hypothetical protein